MSKRIKLFWEGSDEQVKHLKRLAHATGHASIRELFGTCVSAGLATIERTLQAELDKLKSAAAPADELIVQVEPAQSKEASSAADLPITP